MLKIEGIGAAYGEFRVLHEISLEVRSGETAIAVGPNGAGKTTLLKVISGLLKPSSGIIYFDGERIDDREPHEIVGLGISLVPERGRLFPYLSVLDNLKIGSFSKKARKDFRKALDETFGLFPILKDRKKQLAGSLSGGERQMLAIARSLMSRPKLVMLDEPSSGLAPKIISRVFEFVRNIKSQGYSILMVEQNARKALELADRAYILESGKLQFHGGKEDFIRNPYIKKAYLGI